MGPARLRRPGPGRPRDRSLNRYHERPAAAWVRSRLALPPELAGPPLADLSPESRREIVERGAAAGLELHPFKRAIELPRVERVLGLLAGLAPAELLDVGSGRGVFLWPLLERFPDLPVLAIDLAEHRVERILEVARGGYPGLSSRRMDATALDLPDRSFDVVTALEVLEHIPAVERAVAEVVRVARRFVLASVPSKDDDNPEHVHLFAPADLVRLFRDAGAQRVAVEGVLNHRIVVARVGDRK